jgi:ATP synthase protein I
MTEDGKRASQPYDGDHEGTGPSPTFQADAMGSTIIAYLVTGPALFGGIGWLLSQWLGTTFFIPVGILLGMSLSLYVIWLRYGRA